MRTLTSLITAAALAAPAFGQLTFRLVATVDVDSTANVANPEFIGTNPAAVAWDGTDLWLAGYNNSPNPLDVGITRIADALGAAVAQPAFGIQGTTPSFRGYSGLDLNSGTLMASFDVGAVHPEGITAWDAATGGSLWAKSARGGSGVGFDPGFAGAGSGAGWTTFGSGRRSLQDLATGADIYDSSNGMIIDAGVGFFWRCMAFDDATGDIYLREGNNLVKGTRSGANAISGTSVLFDPLDEDFIAGQNCEFIDGEAGRMIVFNNREFTNTGQDFDANIFVELASGGQVPIIWDGLIAPTGNAWYDFAWHGPSNTLAIVDFANRDVHIVEVLQGLGTNYCVANANSTGVGATISATGSAAAADNLLTLTVGDMPNGQFAYFVCGQASGFIANPGGSQGNLCILGQLGRFRSQLQNSGSAGSVSIDVDLTQIPLNPVVAVQPGDTWYFQLWYRDNNPGPTSNFSDGIQVDFL
jgi:hypothetical protein